VRQVSLDGIIAGGKASRRGRREKEEGSLMPYYLIELSYTKEAVADLVQNPQDRIEAVRPAYEELGVTIREAYLAFGEYTT